MLSQPLGQTSAESVTCCDVCPNWSMTLGPQRTQHPLPASVLGLGAGLGPGAALRVSVGGLGTAGSDLLTQSVGWASFPQWAEAAHLCLQGMAVISATPISQLVPSSFRASGGTAFLIPLRGREAVSLAPAESKGATYERKGSWQEDPGYFPCPVSVTTETRGRLEPLSA